MAKVISQDTYNEVVKENIEEFDMEEEDAVKDAITQFETQGINLSNIIKYPSQVKKIDSLIANLEKMTLLENLDETSKSTLEIFSKSVQEEISCKVYAAKMGAYTSLIKCFKNCRDQIKVNVIETLIVLMDGYPDLLDAEGIDLLVGLIDTSLSPELVLAGLRWLAVAVSKQEKTRSIMISRQIPFKLRSVIEKYGDKEEIVVAVCNAVQILILDDDIRVTHGDAHEHGRALATQLLQLLVKMLTKHVSNLTLTVHLLSVITVLLIRNEFCVEFHENDGLKSVLDAMVEHPDDENVSRQCFLLLKSLAGSDEVKEAIISAGAAPLFVSSFNKHYKRSNVAIAGCMCYAALTLRSPTNTKALTAAGGPETLVRCLFHWKKNRSIIKHGCSAIRNQLSRCPELKEEYQNLQVEELLKEGSQIHGDLGFEAKNVLLDLGCDVKLKEEWKGTGIQLRQ